MKTIMNGRDLDTLPRIFRFSTGRCREVEARVYRHDTDGGEGAPWLAVSNVALHEDSPGRHVHFSLTFTGADARPSNPIVSREFGTRKGRVTRAERDTVVSQVREELLAFLAADPAPLASWWEDGDWRTQATADR